ncbi:MAG: hypothetical protein IAE78_30630 [Myxococcus sp.]|nr:hypothetical protein [Myxococcus sp.]
MTRRTVKRHQRGIAMVSVLVALLLLTVIASGFFLQARDTATLSNITATQIIATNNAEMGLQEGVRRIRSAQVPRVAVLTCTVADVNANLCGATYSVGPVMGTGPNLLNGGGLQYQFIIYRLSTPDFTLPANRYIIRSTGFFGTDLNSESLVTSVIEAEVDMGTGFKTSCVGGYECI